jgi:hypothetical protein
MPVLLDPVKLRTACHALGIIPQELQALQRLPLEKAREKFEEIKARVHKNYKRLAFELHPDRTGTDPDQTELFKLVGAVKSDFDKLKLEPRPQPQPVVFHPMPMPGMRVQTWSSASTARSASTTVTVRIGIPLHVATMRPT